MLIIVDKHNDLIIQKVVTPRGQILGYQVGRPGDNFERFPTLTEARKRVGKPMIVPSYGARTQPKTVYPQNQPGYRAGAHKGKK